MIRYLLAFAVLIALGWYMQAGLAFYPLALVGGIFAIGSGFASFSRGNTFRNGRGDVTAVVLLSIDLLIAMSIGWLYGWLLGIVAMIVFWPVLYRLGAKIVLTIIERGVANPPRSS